MNKDNNKQEYEQPDDNETANILINKPDIPPEDQNEQKYYEEQTDLKKVVRNDGENKSDSYEAEYQKKITTYKVRARYALLATGIGIIALFGAKSTTKLISFF